jgi:hypothetical protein
MGMLKLVDIKALKAQQLKETNPSLELLLRNFFFITLWFRGYTAKYAKNKI